MNRVLTNAEFFTYENEVWIRTADGSMRVLRETDYDIVNELCERISTFYPKAFEALSTEYKGCSLNRSYYLYRIVCRFIRCNFAALDSIPDIGPNHLCTFEHINCPLRGEGKFDHIICRPEFDHQLSPAEKRVMALVKASPRKKSANASGFHLLPFIPMSVMLTHGSAFIQKASS